MCLPSPPAPLPSSCSKASQGFASRQLKSYATLSYKRPWTVCCSVTILTVLMSGIVVGAGLFAITPENGKVRERDDE